MSFLSDIAELAKAGYKPQDVKDLLQLSKPLDAEKSQTQPPQTETEQTVLQPESPKADKPLETAPKESEQPKDETDYKALYEAEQEKVKALQNKNNQADISGNKNEVTEAELIDLVKSFC